MNKILSITIVLLSLIVGFLIIDLFFFKPIIPHLPLNRIVYLERPMRTLAETSKDGLIPEHPYIIIVGDSYARGNGDWLLDCDKSASPPPPYQASHILHKMLDTDVLTIARPGSDCLRTIASDLPNQYDYINRMWIYNLPEPDILLFYFYAGNDLTDNIYRLEKSYYPSYDKNKIYDEKYFQAWLDKYIDDNMKYFPLVNFTSIAYTGKVVADYMDRVRDSVVAKFKRTKDSTETLLTPDWTGINVIDLNGKNHQMNRTIQNSSLNMDPEEFNLGFYMLDQALQSADKRFPKVKKALVYIPPVMDCYTYTSPYVLAKTKSTPEQCRRTGLLMEKRSAEIAEKHNLLFINTTTGLRKAAGKEMIHGPKDLKHLNKKGYHVFAKIIAENLHKAGWVKSIKNFSYMKTDLN